MTSGSSVNPRDMWDNQSQPVPVVRKPKKKYRWGIPEIVGSLLLMLVLQLVISSAFIIYFVSQITLETNGSLGVDEVTDLLLKRVTSSGPLILVSSLAMYVSWIGGMWFSTRFRGHRSWAKDFWLYFRKGDWWKGLLLAAGLFGTINGVMWLLTWLGVDVSGADNSSIFLEMEGLWLVILAGLLVPFLGPICEELFFRGFLLQGLIRWFRRGNNQGPKTAFGQWWLDNFAPAYNIFHAFRTLIYRWKYTLSIIISSLLFGIMHFQGAETFGQWLVVIVTGTLGSVFAIVTVRTRRLGIAIFGHVFYNGTTMAIALVQMSLM